MQCVITAERHLNSSWVSSGSTVYCPLAVCWLSRSVSRKYLRMNDYKGISVFNIKCFGVLWASRKKPLLNIMAHIRHMIEVFYWSSPETLKYALVQPRWSDKCDKELTAWFIIKFQLFFSLCNNTLATLHPAARCVMCVGVSGSRALGAYGGM